MPARSGKRELIVYATPAGALGLACERFFDVVVRTLRSTEAQTYPPHCTLTGFFWRSAERADTSIAELGRVLADAGPVPDDAVAVTGLELRDHWIGLALDSPWLEQLIAELVTLDNGHGEELLRPKSWLHLSLAYPIEDPGPYHHLATRIVDPAAPARWELAVWERTPASSWIRHPLPSG